MPVLNLFRNKIPSYLIVTFYSWIGRAISILCSLYILKLTTNFLGVVDYSIYVILVNIIGWALLFDLGLGYSLQNYISELKNNKKEYNSQIWITSVILFIFLTLSAFILWLLTPYLSNIIFGKYEITAKNNFEKLFFIASLIGLLTAFGSVTNKIFYGLQKGHLPNLILALAGLLNVISLHLLKYFGLISLENVLVVTLGLNAIITIIPIFYFYYKSKLSNWKFDNQIAKKLIKRGAGFGLFALMSACVLQVDYLVMSQSVSPIEITKYNILFKLFSVIFIAYSTLLSALWPMFLEWRLNGKIELITKNIRRYVLLSSFVFIIFTIILIFKGQLLISMLTKLEVSFSIELTLLVGLYFIIRVWTDMFAMVLQSMNKLKPFWILTPAQAMVSIILQLLLSQKFGIIGIVIALILSFVLTVSWALPIFALRSLQMKYPKQ
jgi:O-antigen/teichoic acid export membrane protein